jgi:hypothetical protein
MFAKLNISAKKIILITGMTRSGKTLLSPIISSMKDSEQFFFSTISENILVMNYMKKINLNTADHLIKKTINESIYDKLLGRNLNTKKNDYTSIYSHRKKKLYLKRANLPKDFRIEKAIELKKNIFPILFHAALLNLPLIENSFNKPYIINISRHPVDIICSWKKKKYGKDHYLSTTSTVCNYNYNGKMFPFFCLGIEKNIFKQKTNEDRILKMIFNLNHKFKKNYKNSKNKTKIILIKLDLFVTNPKKYIKQICSQFNLQKTKFLETVLKEQKCPRTINFEKREINKKIILSKLSNENKIIFSKMIIDYESNSLTF